MRAQPRHLGCPPSTLLWTPGGHSDASEAPTECRALPASRDREEQGAGWLMRSESPRRDTRANCPADTMQTQARKHGAGRGRPQPLQVCPGLSFPCYRLRHLRGPVSLLLLRDYPATSTADQITSLPWAKPSSTFHCEWVIPTPCPPASGPCCSSLTQRGLAPGGLP